MVIGWRPRNRHHNAGRRHLKRAAGLSSSRAGGKLSPAHGALRHAPRYPRPSPKLPADNPLIYQCRRPAHSLDCGLCHDARH
ncbi:hypothetical protein EVAR_51835_1 [Eumeta japonica]|uniref:Uncharacterized protein n=1 Tax=Eumeta variegata TaxID=151549 RepID=A0A4C1YMW6_EUMVA|nr:hypothetical protein EVAR_51835_1 [Eumeta japonica]